MYKTIELISTRLQLQALIYDIGFLFRKLNAVVQCVHCVVEKPEPVRKNKCIYDLRIQQPVFGKDKLPFVTQQHLEMGLRSKRGVQSHKLYKLPARAEYIG